MTKIALMQIDDASKQFCEDIAELFFRLEIML